ncbi:alpha/beta-hydrolase [Neocallimastix lanati (nom. inval.)]|jgi:pimeloyl-ACP methyl ester carboxylesterase|uniref:Alpha/beta-hydrolase n=1 Tax=Neocallimastix californiae TaxID=1754190 RepID=A0A1Y2BRF3_9FUNG|nr:alpha/beta-hydrolase [Neocallimastix sp. JGI-2020a]ORY37338.1 alpha/beta-hydrolase [Neocallimastix californiae]|eukprot:ORY37338.1 alpha/beta-hydrolase [Neocallimastix californiae]
MQNTDSNEIKYNPLINCNVTLENNNIISIPVSEIHIPVKTGITLAGKVFGNLPTTNPKNKIIALHGWLDNCELYSDIAPKIVANYFKKNETISLIAFDSAGHGLSDHRSEDYGEIYYLWDYIADFISALDLLEWKNCTLMGHSYGGILTYVIASSFSSKVNGLIVYENLGFMNFQTPEMHPMLLTEYIKLKTNDLKRKNKRTVKVFPTFDAACQNRAQGRYSTSLSVSKKLLKRGLKRIKPDPEHDVKGGYIYTYDTRIIYSNYMLPITWSLEQVKSFFEKIKCPTMVILASNGLYPDGDTEGRLKFLTNTKEFRYHVVNGNHHFLLEEESINELTQLTNSFLESLE